MPTTSTAQDVFPKASIPPEEAAKAFDENQAMDDSDAFLETGSADALDDAAPELQGVNDWRPAKSLKQLQSQVSQAFQVARRRATA
jgi:hypothetical protein